MCKLYRWTLKQVWLYLYLFIILLLLNVILILQTVRSGGPSGRGTPGRGAPSGRGALSGRGAPSGRGSPSGRGKELLPRGMQPIAMKKQDGMLVPEGNSYTETHLYYPHIYTELFGEYSD